MQNFDGRFQECTGKWQDPCFIVGSLKSRVEATWLGVTSGTLPRVPAP